jgi:hypothetical protein
MITLHSSTLNLTWNLTEGINNLGSDPDNSIHLAHPSVKPFHAVLICKQGTFTVRSLQSGHDLRINNQLANTATLSLSSTFMLGQVDLTLLDTSSPSNTVAPPSTPPNDIEVIVPALAVHTDRPTLEDGTLACRKHPQAAATVQCTACERAYCSDCVRPVGLQGGVKRLFCPHCSQPCVPLYTQQTPTRKLPPLRRALRWFQRILRN